MLSNLGTHDLPRSKPRALPEGRWDLPTLLDFDIEQAALQSLLRSGTPPVIEVSGPLGSGKTALVQRIPGALYIDAGGLGYRAFLQRLYERAFSTDVVYLPSVDALHAAFERWRTPIVIDDFEGSISELHETLEILERVPVIYTTVEPLEIEPTAEFRLSGLRPDTAYKLFEHYYGNSIAGEHAIMELVSIYLEGNPLMIAQAGAIARAKGLAVLQGPGPLAATIFNSMTIGEQQILATIAGYKGARPDRKTVEVVSGIRAASGTINSLLARHAIETDGERLWLSPLVSYPVEAVLPSLIRYDAMFAYADSVLSQGEVPRSVVENPAPFVFTLRLALSRGCYAQAARNGRVLGDALLLAGSIDAAREVCELVREASSEVGDQVVRAWAQHQTGVLAALMGNREEAVSYLKSAVLLRERIGDTQGKLCSEKNLALLPGERIRRRKKRSLIGLGDLITIVCAMALAAVAALGYMGDWHTQRVPRPPHALKAHAENLAGFTQSR